MRTATLRLEDMKTTIINMGYVGENEHKQIRFDGKKMFQEYPNASVSLTVCPACGDAYPATIERDGDFVLWTITDSDLVAEGCGEIQLTFTESPHIAKSYICRTKVLRSLVPTGDIPSGLDDFITRADALLEELEDAIPEGGTTGQVLAKKSNDDFDTEWVDQTGGGGTGDYTDLNNKPQIGGVTLTGNKTLHDLGAATEEAVGAKYTKPSGGIPASDMASGVIPVLTDLIDDTAGDGDTDKVWSADKSADTVQSVLSQINSKMDEPETEGTAGQVLTTDGNGGRTWTDKPTVPAIATSAQIKAGTDSTHPIAPNRQNESVFYALAKLAGADMASLSGETVGVYPDAQKVAIQKMLGIYEAPWELIREDTVTNATEADIVISVDGDGQNFEIESAVILFETPKQETQSSKGDYGLVRFEKNGVVVFAQYGSQWTQEANANANGLSVEIANNRGMVSITSRGKTETTKGGTLTQTYGEGFTGMSQALFYDPNFSITSIKITKVTGTGHYKLYGRRKWTV